MWTAVIAMVAGFALLIWSADRFVLGAASTARHMGLPPLLIGMVVVGFGTSMPELIVSSMAAMGGTPDLALGNGWGSNIANIALILGVASLIRPVIVGSRILNAQLPQLTIVTLLAVGLVVDGNLALWESLLLLLFFVALMTWTIRKGLNAEPDTFGVQMESDLKTKPLMRREAIIWTVIGLLILIGSSRILVWGAISLARGLGVSELVIGLSIVALGTSLPELAAALAAARRGENDIVLGNVIGSNLFNTLAVVGLAGTIHPFRMGSEVIWRDGSVMLCLTFSLFVFGHGWRGRTGRINRWEGALLIMVYMAYMAWLGFGR